MGGVKVEEEGKGDAEGTTFDELCKMILPVSALKACRKGGKFACLPRSSRASEPPSHANPLMACVVNRCRKSRILLPSESCLHVLFSQQLTHQSTCDSICIDTLSQRLPVLWTSSSASQYELRHVEEGMLTGTNKLIKFPHACLLVPTVDGAKVNDRPSTHRPLCESQDLIHSSTQ